ncbi:hypothetical protein CAPTEDRAFT_185568 [Capitella teleta]|uniref:Eukaryotic translation initiation factor 5A n=1 Tax=Capitella teleta TaxID=283909 RepID=R7V265_CAPTE|nr:hypothetical protein CAPTEDRAFT_185568 [Capitella teleta]|eukprot:ELU12624.1 hypothetical protein CAPTEDRAFT_185568 [Capitella teleta]
MSRKSRRGEGDVASNTVPQKCSSLRKSGFALLNQNPCKIIEMNTSAPGKHGHAKIHLVGLNIFSEKKVDDICVSTHNMQVPIVKRQEYEVLGMDHDGYCTLMDINGHLRSDLKLTNICNVHSKVELDRLRDRAEEDQMAVIATVWTAMGDEAVKSIRIGKHI